MSVAPVQQPAHDAGVAFDVVDVLGGLCELRRSSATLDGSIPLRAAQACSPLLDGNRFGFQLVLTESLELARGAFGPKLAHTPEPIRRALSATVPRLFAEGLLDRAWQKTLERGLVTGAGLGKSEATLFTGLCLRARPGFVLRLSHAGNRRNLLFGVEETWLRPSAELVPLFVRLKASQLPLILSGEIATLAPLSEEVSVVETDLAGAPELGRAHASFFDPSYFDQKKRGPTQKYKRLLARPTEPSERSELRIAHAGATMTRAAESLRFLGPRGFERRASPELGLLRFENGVPLEALFDGHQCRVTPDRGALGEHAERVRRAWKSTFERAFVDEHFGARLYFEKYVTPHQPGEPYFFVKPPALLQTSPGWSLLIDGTESPDFSVLRGVTASDVFHAAPAVIRLDHPGRRVRVEKGAELARLVPFPRALFDARYETLSFHLAPRLRA